MNAYIMTRIAGKLDRVLNPDDELQSWSITRRTAEVEVVMLYRSGYSHTIRISTADPDFIQAGHQ